jgi:hypothetical protein
MPVAVSGGAANTQRLASRMDEWPNSGNTGVPAGTTLTTYTGSSTISADGTVLDSFDILTGGLTITGNNVTIKRCRIRATSGVGSGEIINPSGSTGLLIQDCEIDGQALNGHTTAVGFSNFTLRRCNIHDVGEGANMDSNVVVDACYIHDLYGSTTSHNNCLITNGGSNFTIVRNTLDAAYGPFSPPSGAPPGDGSGYGISSALSLFGDFAAVSTVQVIGNLFASGGSYMTYAGSEAGKPFPLGDHIVYLDNAFSVKESGYFGPVTGWDASGVGNSWVGNYWLDGPNRGQQIVA